MTVVTQGFLLNVGISCRVCNTATGAVSWHSVCETPEATFADERED